ncbi:MAG: hypothetical protein C0498_08640 [Anaerolinea sp.]|nr:hypothetical protein [Anaerolinea sp.]
MAELLHTTAPPCNHFIDRRIAASGCGEAFCARGLSSWLNLVERWFRELTTKRIRRGVFRGVPDLVATIYAPHRTQQHLEPY